MTDHRDITWKRDQGRCVRCGRHLEGIQASLHHRILGNRTDNRPSNLIWLCGSGTTGCHLWVHANGTASRDAGWIVSRHGPRENTLTVAVRYAVPDLARLLDDAGDAEDLVARAE